jgi:hypothetical protein
MRTLLAVMLAALPVAAQAQKSAAQPQKGYIAPKGADGKPDLSGYWTNVTLTPLERPANLAGKAFFTPAEAAKYETDTVERNDADRRDGGSTADISRAYNNFWWDRGTKVVSTLRTSLIVDPPDGRIPPLTAEAQARRAAQRAAAQGHDFDGPENRALSERCLVWATAGPPMLPSFYNNNYQIAQSPGYVAILVEMIHDVRIIPTEGRPHLPGSVGQWFGDPRGHWEGNTLVVETTNFGPQVDFHGSDQNMKLTEKFTRTGPKELMYEFTVDDPTAFTRPFTGQVPMHAAEGPILEYACNEGNYAMSGMLGGARADEKAAAEAARQNK